MNLYLAPMMGITTVQYRNAYVEIFGGLDGLYTPFVATTHMRKKNSTLFDDILPENNTHTLPIFPQLLGNNSSDFKFFAHTITQLGYKEINWNIGCPYPAVTRKKKGSGILPYPEMIDAFLDNVCEQMNYNLSVKMRLGFDNASEGLKVIEILNQYPIANVTIHGRVGKQRYEGDVDLDGFSELYKACNHPVIYNGDVLTISDYKRVHNRFPDIDEIMIGRGALRNPFLASEIKRITFSEAEKLEKLRRFHKVMYDHFHVAYSNEQFLCGQLKKFWEYTAYALNNRDEFLNEIRLISTLTEYHRVCDKYLG